MEMLSEHQCEGWLEGYLLTGRHGVFNCYEAFIHIVDSMFNQHAKWLQVSSHVPWRSRIASLNYLLASHVWRQDHNGFTHQDPGFIDVVMNKKAEVVRVHFPPDGNCLLSVMDHCDRAQALYRRTRPGHARGAQLDVGSSALIGAQNCLHAPPRSAATGVGHRLIASPRRAKAARGDLAVAYADRPHRLS